MNQAVSLLRAQRDKAILAAENAKLDAAGHENERVLAMEAAERAEQRASDMRTALSLLGYDAEEEAAGFRSIFQTA